MKGPMAELSKLMGGGLDADEILRSQQVDQEPEEQAPEEQEPEPAVGSKKAKPKRRKKLYQPKFDGEAPSAEDGGFSLFTDKNGRDCR